MLAPRLTKFWVELIQMTLPKSIHVTVFARTKDNGFSLKEKVERNQRENRFLVTSAEPNFECSVTKKFSPITIYPIQSFHSSAHRVAPWVQRNLFQKLQQPYQVKLQFTSQFMCGTRIWWRTEYAGHLSAHSIKNKRSSHRSGSAHCHATSNWWSALSTEKRKVQGTGISEAVSFGTESYNKIK